MRNIKKQRGLALLLSVTLLFSQMGLTTLAEKGGVAAYLPGSLCEHHREHNDDCGYSKEAACTHEHTEDCYHTETVCTVIDLGEGEENIATPPDATEQTEHECTVESGCIKEVLDCVHEIGEHDETCGYAAATPCNFACEECRAPEDSGETDNVAPGVSSITVVAFDALDEAIQQQTVPVGTVLADLNLPDTLTATGYIVTEDTEILDSGTPSDVEPTIATITIAGVEWVLDPENEINNGNSTYDPTRGSYAFTPVLPEEYTLAEGLALPEIKATILVANRMLLATVTYIDDIGTEQTAIATPITAETSELNGNTSGWYYVPSGLDISGGTITVNGTVNLILEDGGSLTATGGRYQAGINVSGTNSLTIYGQSSGTGSLNAKGGEWGAGIGGGQYGAGGTITINGGMVTATGDGAGIGGGSGGGAGGIITINGGTVTATGRYTSAGIGGGGNAGDKGGAGGIITINGGTVTATCAEVSAGIGGGYRGENGTFSTGENGNAFIVTNTISDKRNYDAWSGVIFEGKTGEIYGNSITLTTDAEVSSDQTLTIKDGKTLTIASEITLTNFGGITIQSGGKLDNEGSIQNYGAIYPLTGATFSKGTINHIDGGEIVSRVAANYIAADGTPLSQDSVLPIRGGLLDWNAGWYVVDKDATISERITVTSDVHLILADGGSLNATRGISVGENQSLTIYSQKGGTGKLTATGDGGDAGIGGNHGQSGGTITITGGTINATGFNGPGIGIGATKGSGKVTVNISGGHVIAKGTGGSNQNGIGAGGGANGSITINITGGTVEAVGSTAAGGLGGLGGRVSIENAFVITNNTIDSFNGFTKTSGAIFNNYDNNKDGTVYGTPTLKSDAEIPAGKTLTIPDGKTLTLGSGVTLTNKGKIIVENGGELDTSTGIFNNFSVLEGVGTKPDEGDINNKEANITLEASLSSAIYNSSVTLTATVAEKQTNILNRNAIPQKTVVFYCGGKEIGRETVSNGSASTTISLTGEKWKPGIYSFTAEYGGGDNNLLPATSNEITLTVNKAEQSATSVTVSSTSAIYGGAAPTITPVTVLDSATVIYSAVFDTSGSSTDVATISGATITMNKAGTFYVKAVIAATDYYAEKTIYSEKITVGAADSAFITTVKNGDETKNSFIYGDTITVEVTDIAVKSSNSRAVQKNTVYLFATTPGDSPDTSAAIAQARVANNAATLTYNTTGKALEPEDNKTLYVVYGGNDNLKQATQAVTVNLAAKPLTAAVNTSATSASRPYDGTSAFTNVALTLSDIVGSDTVTATASGTSASATVGSSTFSASAIALAGTDAKYYALATTDVSGNVTISKATQTVTTDIGYGNGPFTYGDEPQALVATPAFSQTGAIAYTSSDSDVISVHGTTGVLTFHKASSTPVTITATNTVSNYEDATSTVEITVAQKNANTATITVNGTYTYTGSPLVPESSNVKVELGGVTIPATQYDFAASNHTNAGSAILTVTFKDNYTGTASGNFTIGKATGNDISGDVIGSYTGNGMTFTYTITPISGAEYRMDSGEWQSSNVFSGIAPSSAYIFSARMLEQTNYEAGAAKSTGTITFSKLDVTDPPILGYTVIGARGNRTITITQVEGAEYQFGNDPWSDTNAKTYDTDATVTIGIRFKATATHNASTAATAEINLAKGDQEAPLAFALIVTPNDEVNYTVTIPEVNGCEYSFDGVTYGTTRTKTANVGDTVTGYMRKAETDTLNASGATSATATLPQFQVKPVTVSPNGGSFTNSVSVTLGTETAGTTIYYTTDGAEPTGASNEYTGAFTLSSTTTVKAVATKSGMTDSSISSFTFTKSSSGSGGGHTSTTTDPTKPNTPTTGAITIGKPDGSGNVSIPGGQITDAIDKALKDAQSSGGAGNGVAIDVKLSGGTTSASLDRTTLDKLIASDVKSFGLEFQGAALGFDLPALKEIVAGSTGAVTFGAARAAGLNGDALAVIGTRPSYILTVSYQADGRTAYLTNFGAGSVSAELDYIPAANEQNGTLYAVYVDGSGRVTWLNHSSYDRNARTVRFATNHFSVFGIGYQTAPAFTDITAHWAKDSIQFAAGRSLLAGTGSTTFSPDAPMTRGMLVTALGRLSGIDVNSYRNGSFADVAADASYAPYVNWAVDKGIAHGTGTATFAPDAAITREQMAVIMANYAKATGYAVPKTRDAITFGDAASISPYARDAVKTMQMAGILNGRSNNTFDPKLGTTRAEAAAALHRYVELLLDHTTAQGFDINDSGVWVYYENGKLATGWRQIDGKWYYFYTNGVMAANTQIDGFVIGADGARI